jgi:hypothetical protein
MNLEELGIGIVTVTTLGGIRVIKSKYKPGMKATVASTTMVLSFLVLVL